MAKGEKTILGKASSLRGMRTNWKADSSNGCGSYQATPRRQYFVLGREELATALQKVP